MLSLFRRFFHAPRVDDLLPIVIPTEIVAHPAWVGPSIRWNDVLSVTWGHFEEPYITTFLIERDAAELVERRKDYPRLALQNLRRRSKDKLWSHIKKENGAIHFLGLLHEDGLGPSRLLLRDELRQVFPKGYCYCVPERTCAVVFSKEAGEAARASVRELVGGCFRTGREPVSDQIFNEDEIKAW